MATWTWIRSGYLKKETDGSSALGIADKLGNGRQHYAECVGRKTRLSVILYQNISVWIRKKYKNWRPD